MTEKERLPTYNFLPTFKPPRPGMCYVDPRSTFRIKRKGRIGRPTRWTSRSRLKMHSQLDVAENSASDSFEKPATEEFNQP